MKSDMLCIQCLLGDNYGAVPVPAVIEEAEFRQLRNELIDSGEGRLFVLLPVSKRFKRQPYNESAVQLRFCSSDRQSCYGSEVSATRVRIVGVERVELSQFLSRPSQFTFRNPQYTLGLAREPSS